MKQAPWEWRIVLVRPRNPLNIGAAARAMANFGFSDLVVVEPHEPVWRETRSAVGAEGIVRSARAVPGLKEAIADRTVVIGTTSGSRRNLDRELIPLDELGEWLRDGAGKVMRGGSARAGKGTRRRAALLFGSEKTGLSNDCLSHCHALLRIPTTPDCPSMNLGQAVALCCYELARFVAPADRSAVAAIPTLRDRRGLSSNIVRRHSAAPSPRQPKLAPPNVHLSDRANMQSLLHVFERAERVLDEVGFLKPKSREATLLKLRRLLLDFGLTNNDVKILGGVLAQIEWKLKSLL
jgi:TrmH family RNA methyltransferase